MIKIAIVGVGNCASSLIQGISKFKKDGSLVGVQFQEVGPYTPGDIEVVAAFDIDERKVGKDISEAIFSDPNNTLRFFTEVPITNVFVSRGETHDGLSEHMKECSVSQTFVESTVQPCDVVNVLKKSGADILINYLPVGSQKATEFYANCCLEAGVHFINAIPVFICSENSWIQKFEEKNLVCAGDDIKAQVGATIVHRVLTDLFEKRGAKITNTYQLNVGGNTDFLNMTNRDRLHSKKISKTQAVQSQMKEPLGDNDIHIGPSDYVPWLKDTKKGFIRIEGELFGGAPITLEVNLTVEDSPNSAGVMIDAIRFMKKAIDEFQKGYLKELSAFSFKHPLIQMNDHDLSLFLKNEARK